jgi:hypothetical protein
MTMEVVGPSDTLRHRVPADLKYTKGDANRPEIRGWGGLCVVRYTVEPLLSGLMTNCLWPDNK